MRLLKGLLTTLIACVATSAWALTDRQVQEAVELEVRDVLSQTGPGGAAVAVRMDGRTLFFNFGTANQAGKPITSDSLFNLASLSKTFDVTLLAMAVVQDEVSLDDPAAKYIPEFRKGGDIRKVTLGPSALADRALHATGLSAPSDHLEDRQKISAWTVSIFACRLHAAACRS
jgi:beta-lactamase class C